MPVAVEITYTGAPAELKAAEQSLSIPRGFLHQANLAVLSNALLTLRQRLRGEHRTNNLARSLQAGDVENINDVNDTEAVVGSSVPYAGKVNEGGPIYPIGKMLAIPLTDFLKNPLAEDNWPRDYDPERKRLQTAETDEGRLILFDPKDERFRWLLVPSINWGEGYHYLDWNEQNIDDVTSLYWDLFDAEFNGAT